MLPPPAYCPRVPISAARPIDGAVVPNNAPRTISRVSPHRQITASPYRQNRSTKFCEDNEYLDRQSGSCTACPPGVSCSTQKVQTVVLATTTTLGLEGGVDALGTPEEKSAFGSAIAEVPTLVLGEDWDRVTLISRIDPH